MVRKGDTLIEVTLAVGIFSMVAVSVVTVLGNDTSDAQTALETTLAREEINTQAEALRFIQSSYISGKDNVDEISQNYSDLWKEITGKAVNAEDDLDDKAIARYVNFSPSSCAELYSGDNEQISKGFVINPRALSNGIETYENIKESVVSNSEASKPLSQTITYPRLLFNSDTSSTLINSDIGRQVQKAEGIYVIAVKDANTTTINGEDKSAFYDFYIRTCWYATNGDQPLTVSTVVRLYDPEALPTIIKPKI